MSRRGEIRHVYPTWGRLHLVDGPGGRKGECWCKPRLMQLCQQCNGSKAGCWACEKGLIEVTAIPPGDRGLVVHNAPGEPTEG